MKRAAVAEMTATCTGFCTRDRHNLGGGGLRARKVNQMLQSKPLGMKVLQCEARGFHMKHVCAVRCNMFGLQFEGH